MKYLFFIPFAILLGLVAGSWIPQQELTKLRNEVRQLKKESENTSSTGKLSALNNIIKIPDRKSGRKPVQTNESHINKEAATNITANLPDTTDATVQGVETNLTAEKKHRRKRRFPDPKSDTFDKDLEEAKELWETRVEIARSQWISRLGLSGNEEQLFDEAIAAMNEDLYLTMEVVADGLQDNSEMTTEAGLRVVNQVTETLVKTYDNLREIVPEEKHLDLEKMEMQDFIDPTSFEPLIDVRDKL